MPGSRQFSTIISAEELNKNLDQDGWIIVDCRFDLMNPDGGLDSYKSNHIPGAVYAHLDEDLSSQPTDTSGRHPLPDWSNFKKTLGAWGIDNQTQVVVYDDNLGGIAGRLWWMLRALGHDTVALLDGGWAAWVRRGYEIEDGVVTNSRKTFEGDFRGNWTVSVDRIEQSLNQSYLLLIDSRDGARYRGESEPIDAGAGHIPGALNHFFAENLDDQGKLLSPGQLKQQFESLIGNRPLEEVVVYCGSGVSACQNLIALEHAGLSGAKLYVGSWSEWSRKLDRSFNTGDAP